MPLPWNFAPLASGPSCNVRYVPNPPFRSRHLKCGRGPAKLSRFGFFANSTIFSLSARGEYSMPSVKLRENEPFEVALRRFKRTCEKAGVLTETRRREFYEKPTTVRKRKAAAAVKRHLKKMQRTRVARVRLYCSALLRDHHSRSQATHRSGRKVLDAHQRKGPSSDPAPSLGGHQAARS